MAFSKIYIGSDHAGFEAKSGVIKFLKKHGVDVEDKGTYSLDSVDYPDFAHEVSRAVSQHPSTGGILICGSGNGVCMSANKHAGIRAGLAWNPEVAGLIRQHNDANVICLPARFSSQRVLNASIALFLNTDFEGGRHQQRVDKLDAFDHNK